MDRPRFSSAFLHPRYWPLWFGLGLLWLVVQLPYPVLLMLGRGLGALMYRLVGSRREIAARNLELCFPEKSPAERERLLKENFASSGIAFFEMAMSWWWPKARLARLAHIEGLEHLREAQAQGEGVILMALHFTTLEIGAALLGQVHTIDGMYREHDNPVFDYVQRRGRERHNLDATAIEREDVRSMLKVLRGGAPSGTHRTRTTAPSRACSCRCSASRRPPSPPPPSSPAWAGRGCCRSPRAAWPMAAVIA